MGDLSRTQIDALKGESGTRIDRAGESGKLDTPTGIQKFIQEELQALYKGAFAKQENSDKELHRAVSKELPLAMTRPETQLSATDYKELVDNINNKLNKKLDTGYHKYIEFKDDGDGKVGAGDSFILNPTKWRPFDTVTLPFTPDKPQVRSASKDSRPDPKDPDNISGRKGFIRHNEVNP